MSFMLDLLRREIGDAATLALVEARGGTTVSVPETAREGQVLVEIVGLAAAEKLSQHYAREIITIPLAKDWRIDLYAARGMQNPEIAKKLGMTTRRVRSARRRIEGPSPQLDLFATSED